MDVCDCGESREDLRDRMFYNGEEYISRALLDIGGPYIDLHREPAMPKFSEHH